MVCFWPLLEILGRTWWTNQERTWRKNPAYLGSLYPPPKTYVLRVCFESPFTRIISTPKYKWFPGLISMHYYSHEFTDIIYWHRYIRVIHEKSNFKCLTSSSVILFIIVIKYIVQNFSNFEKSLEGATSISNFVGGGAETIA